jgi:hypothetical protein
MSNVTSIVDSGDVYNNQLVRKYQTNPSYRYLTTLEFAAWRLGNFSLQREFVTILSASTDTTKWRVHGFYDSIV